MTARGRRVRFVIGALCVGAVGGLLLLIVRNSYASWDSQYDSIHFHGGEPDFGLPPRRAVINWRGEHDDRPQSEDDGGQRSGLELSAEKDEDTRTEIERKRGLMERAVETEIQAGRWSAARRLIEPFGNRYGWRGEMRDRVEIMNQLEARHSPAPVDRKGPLWLYLDALKSEDRKMAQATFQKVSNDPAADFLREHALYQLASLAAELFDYPHAVDLYEQLLTQYPRTNKREDALVMIARCALLPQTSAGQRLEQGRTALAQLRGEFPHTRFQRDLVGLQGRLYFIAGQWPQALRCYYRNDDLASVEQVLKAMPATQRGPVRVTLLAAHLRSLLAARSFQQFVSAMAGADRTRQAMTATQYAQFGRLILEQPETASAYLYYRLYHSEDRQYDHPNVTAREQRDLARFADRLAERHPNLSLSPAVRVRLAEVYYQDRQYPQALTWANRAMHPNLMDRALYVRAATLNKLGQPGAALADFERLLQRFPTSPLAHGARENIAILSEARRDYARALDQYFALDYRPDIAFLLDVRMTPAQIAAYLQHNAMLQRSIATRQGYRGQRINSSAKSDTEDESAVSRRDLIVYSLGIRYLREERWQEARKLLQSLPRHAYLACSKPGDLTENTDNEGNKVATDPLRAVADLERLQLAIERARSDQQRASAMYRCAAYYTHANLLLLYNAVLWHGTREFNFDFNWDRKRETPENLVVIRNYMQAHETYARSHRICLDLIRRYPHSPTVPYALLLAAIDALHLSHFNEWWRVENTRHSYLAEVYQLKARLTHDYPNHHLAQKVRENARIFPEDRNLRWQPPRKAAMQADGSESISSGSSGG